MLIITSSIHRVLIKPENPLVYSRFFHVFSISIDRSKTNLRLLRRNNRLNIPDHLRVFIDAPITAKEAHPAHTRDALGQPLFLVLVCLINQILRLAVAVEVIRDKIVVAMVNDCTRECRKGSRIAEHATLDSCENLLELFVELVVAVDVSMAELFDVFCQVAKEEDVIFADFAGDFDLVHVSICMSARLIIPLTLAPSQVPIISPPLSTNFMLLVPLASVPAVEMCSLISEAGQMISALLTL